MTITVICVLSIVLFYVIDVSVQKIISALNAVLAEIEAIRSHLELRDDKHRTVAKGAEH